MTTRIPLDVLLASADRPAPSVSRDERHVPEKPKSRLTSFRAIEPFLDKHLRPA